jgi:hypothetical protein
MFITRIIVNALTVHVTQAYNCLFLKKMHEESRKEAKIIHKNRNFEGGNPFWYPS